MDYISSENQKTLNATYQRTQLIVVALAVSLLLLIAMGWIIPAQPNASYLDWTRNFYVVAIAMGMGVIVVRRLFLSSFRLKAAKAAGIASVLNAYSMTSIIGAAIGESVGILGLVAYLLTADRQFSWRLGIVGLLIIAFSFPRRFEWLKAVREIEQDRTGQGLR
ncbi:MAG TPA: hypothetical protein VEF04_18410 [Blastocatellia bacterium]|nr:hypothetical protein [Blastocatellia bacterium]